MNFLTPILTGNASLIARILGVILLLVLLAVVYFSIAHANYNKGFNSALKEYPQNVYNGPTTVVQGKKMGCFPFHLGSIGIGICHQ